MILEITAGILVGIAFASMIIMVSRIRSLSRAAHIHYRDQFVALADGLMGDDRLEEESHLRRIGWFLRNIDDRSSAFFVAMYAMDRAEQSAQAGIHPRRNVPAAIEGDWSEMFYFWLMALSYTRPILGIRFRAKLAKILDPSLPHPATECALEGYIPGACVSAIS